MSFGARPALFLIKRPTHDVDTPNTPRLIQHYSVPTLNASLRRRNHGPCPGRRNIHSAPTATSMASSFPYRSHLFLAPGCLDPSLRIHCRDFRWHSSAEEIQANSEALLSSLFEAASGPSDHFQQIDSLFSSILEIRLYQDSARSTTGHQASHVEEAIALLKRLPPTPPQVDLSYRHAWHGNGPGKLVHFLNPGTLEDLEASPRQRSSIPQEYPPANVLWERLTVVTKFSTPTLRLAILVTDNPKPYRDVWFHIRRFLDFVCQLLDQTCLPPDQMPPLLSKHHPDYRDIVQIYLWSTWTRGSLLYFWSVLLHQLQWGYQDSDSKDLMALRRPRILSDTAIRGTIQGWSDQRMSYMCGWAFELLKADRVGLSMDFRYFNRRYGALHGHKPPRCIWESDHPCAGGNPLDRGRFQDRRLVAEEQSVHACDQKNKKPCRKLVWNRESYISIKGPVAVSVSTPTRLPTTPWSGGGSTIAYTCATEFTMAISHVWSHGHGGRPHTGMNSCLHERFSRIAKHHGCDSYWINTLCIPDGHKLRNEAIGYINQVFVRSKIVLVLDRDLMEIELNAMSNSSSSSSKPIPTPIPIPRLEALFATLLVCDWNVRSWTMLEAMKGSHGLYLLCQNESTISVREMLMSLHAAGRVDLVSLGLAMRHIIPSSSKSFGRNASRVSTESGGGMLSHRHATRPGDDIVIWSLISNAGRVFYTAKDMWEARVGRTVRSAFLMSSAPRLTHVPGFSWAPKTPYIRRSGARDIGRDMQNGVSMSSHLVFEGAESEELVITKRGVEGLWMVYRVDLAHESRYKDCPVTALRAGEDGRTERMVFPGHVVVNGCWRKAVELLGQHSEVALLRPKREGSVQTYDLSSAGAGETPGQAFAICVSDDGGMKWFWKGIESWPRDLELPPMTMDELLIA